MPIPLDEEAAVETMFAVEAATAARETAAAVAADDEGDDKPKRGTKRKADEAAIDLTREQVSNLVKFNRKFNGTVKIKIPYVLQRIRDMISAGILAQTKVIFFCEHKPMLAAVENEMFAQGIDYIRIDGTTDQFKRGQYCRKFQEDDKCRAAVLGLRACSTAVTLTAATIVIFTELLCVPSIHDQAADRAHRIGQTKPVTVQFWLLKGSIDTMICKVYKAKKVHMTTVLRSPDEPREANNEEDDAETIED
jgi:SWI/SNF-related matrix-associated actin-dependent regulator 1 of chromatin subfamily A